MPFWTDLSIRLKVFGSNSRALVGLSAIDCRVELSYLAPELAAVHLVDPAPPFALPDPFQCRYMIRHVSPF